MDESEYTVNYYKNLAKSLQHLNVDKEQIKSHSSFISIDSVEPKIRVLSKRVNDEERKLFKEARPNTWGIEYLTNWDELIAFLSHVVGLYPKDLHQSVFTYLIGVFLRVFQNKYQIELFMKDDNAIEILKKLYDTKRTNKVIADWIKEKHASYRSSGDYVEYTIAELINRINEEYLESSKRISKRREELQNAIELEIETLQKHEEEQIKALFLNQPK